MEKFSETDGLAYLYLVESRCCCCRNMFIVGNGLLFYRQARLFPQPEIAATVPEAVRLVLSSGRILDLSDCENVDVREIEGKVILHNGQLEYCSDSVKRNSEETNTLIIPKGAFYHLIFSDGTKVWLNSDSKSLIRLFSQVMPGK